MRRKTSNEANSEPGARGAAGPWHGRGEAEPDMARIASEHRELAASLRARWLGPAKQGSAPQFLLDALDPAPAERFASAEVRGPAANFDGMREGDTVLGDAMGVPADGDSVLVSVDGGPLAMMKFRLDGARRMLSDGAPGGPEIDADRAANFRIVAVVTAMARDLRRM